MKVHHLNCGCFCPLVGGPVVTHCLLLETPNEGLALVDTGLGDHFTRHPEALPWLARVQLRPRMQPTDSALSQVLALGYRASDVRHILLTHLDGDHAGGVLDFPDAAVHIHSREYDAMKHGSARYDTALAQADVNWQRHAVEGDVWHGLHSVRPIETLNDEVALVPLPGHTKGHAGVAVRTDGGWLLHAGDAYLLAKELDGQSLSFGERVAAWITSDSFALRNRNLKRLRDLRASHPELRIVSAHDPAEWQRVRSASEMDAANARATGSAWSTPC